MVRAMALDPSRGPGGKGKDLCDSPSGQKVLCGREEVDGVVEYPRIFPAAGLLRVDSPRAVRRARVDPSGGAVDPRPMPLAHLERPSDSPGLYKLARLHVGSDEHIGFPDREGYTRPFRCFTGGNPLGHTRAERLFAVDVLACS